MKYSLYLNGVYEEVVEEIRKSQAIKPDLIHYLQPSSPEPIDKLAKEPPTLTDTTTLYISLTSSLPFVSYKAEILQWENKQNITTERLKFLNDQISHHQPNEREIYLSWGYDRPAVNLLSVKNLVKFVTPIPVSSFVKISDKEPLQPRKRTGGWSYILPMPSWLGTTTRTAVAESLREEFDNSVLRSMKEESSVRENRLTDASAHAEPILTMSKGFKRNPDVAATVLLRANGVCEQCGDAAPFIRTCDGHPYLEIHHKVTLANGGEDTTSNAIAVCPNCHRKLHFG